MNLAQSARGPDRGPDVAEGREPVIALKDVSRVYASGDAVVRALRSVSLTIYAGEFVAIVGTSGSGKSTMMNILGCLDRPTSGTYELAGTEVGHRSAAVRALARNRLIGFVFQGYNLLPRLTALENTELPLQYRNVSRVERESRAIAALRQVGLAHRLDHRPNQMSGGQQQRVAIARALVTSPPLLLADEPTGNLDTRTTLEVLAMLQELNRTRGLTIVLVTHEPEVAACARRVVTVRDGDIVSDVMNETQTDAAADLARLPPPPPAGKLETEKMLALGKLPWRSYVTTVGGTVIGALAGYEYASLMLDDHAVLGAIIGAMLGETMLACRYTLKNPVSDDQRWKLALATTAAVSVAALLAIWMTPASLVTIAAVLDSSFGRAALPAACAAVLLGLVGMSALRYAILTILGQNPRYRLGALLGTMVAVSLLILGGSAAAKISDAGSHGKSGASPAQSGAAAGSAAPAGGKK